MRPLRRSVVLLSLCLTLMASVASAAGGSSTPTGRDGGGLAGLLLQQLGAFLMAVWQETGCEIDPLGRCTPGGGAPATGALSVDGGCEIDPFGRCIPGSGTPATVAFYAGHIDPWGSTSDGEEAGHIDPFGGR